MKDQQITLYKVDDIADFVNKHANDEVRNKFVDILGPILNKYVGSNDGQAYLSRLTNDPATRLGVTDQMARKEGILALPLRKGIYFYNLLIVDGHKAGDKVERNVPYLTTAVAFVVLDLENMTVEDQTHNLRG